MVPLTMRSVRADWTLSWLFIIVLFLTVSVFFYLTFIQKYVFNVQYIEWGGDFVFVISLLNHTLLTCWTWARVFKPLHTREKSFCKTSFHLRVDGAEKGTETRQRWKSARRLPDICKNMQQMSGSLVFLRSFISALFLSFFQLHRYLSEMKFYRNFFLSFHSFSMVF